MLWKITDAKKLMSLCVSLALLLSLTLVCPPSLFAADTSVSSEDAFRAAYFAATVGDTIVLTTNLTLKRDLRINKNVTIDCGLFVLRIESAVECSAGTITGNGSSSILSVLNGGTLSLTDNATVTTATSAAAIHVEAGGIALLYSKVSSGGHAAVSDGSLTVGQGADISSGNVAIAVGSTGSATISGGSITAGRCVVQNRGGTVTLSGGTLTATQDNPVGVDLTDGASFAMSGGLIQSNGAVGSRGVVVSQLSTAAFSGGVIQTDSGVVVVSGKVTTWVPVEQFGGLYKSPSSPLITASPEAFAMRGGQARTVTVSTTHHPFELYSSRTSAGLNATAAGVGSATIMPREVGEYTLSFRATIGDGDAFVTLNVPVSVTSSSSVNDATSSETEQYVSKPVPPIPETGARTLFLLLLFSLYGV